MERNSPQAPSGTLPRLYPQATQMSPAAEQLMMCIAFLLCLSSEQDAEGDAKLMRKASRPP
ncbi:hypothetical protein DBR06_SOUSAS27610010, partial [Sousa chinensis]